MSTWIALRSIPIALGLMVKAPYWALSYSRSYKRAKRDFKYHLIDEGIPFEEAEQLAELFPFKLSEIIQTAREIN